MANFQARISVKKKRAIKYGRKIVRIHVGSSPEVFVVHEDLLCYRSPYFQKRLQPKRRSVEDKCTICYEDLEPGVDELTFCSSSCGGNMHHKCMKTWEDQQSSARKPVTCPMCRVRWGKQRNDRVSRCQELDPKGFEVFVGWIYHGTISVNQNDTREDLQVAYCDLVQAYILGIHMDDLKFRNAALGALIEVSRDSGVHPGGAAITAAYNGTKYDSGLRDFLVHLYVTSVRAVSFEISGAWKDYPAEFLKDIAVTFMGAREESHDWNIDVMKREHCEEDEELLQEVSHKVDNSRTSPCPSTALSSPPASPLGGLLS